MKILKIEKPTSLSIVNEIVKDKEAAVAFRESLQREVEARWTTYADETNKRMNENLERLRLDLGEPTFGPEKPEIVTDFLQFNLAFIKIKP